MQNGDVAVDFYHRYKVCIVDDVFVCVQIVILDPSSYVTKYLNEQKYYEPGWYQADERARYGRFQIFDFMG